jgi:hypothetical protein
MLGGLLPDIPQLGVTALELLPECLQFSFGLLEGLL